MIKFEKISRFADSDIEMPRRKTAESAGYDMVVAEDTVIPPYTGLYNSMETNAATTDKPLTLNEGRSNVCRFQRR